MNILINSIATLLMGISVAILAYKVSFFRQSNQMWIDSFIILLIIAPLFGLFIVNLFELLFNKGLKK